MSRADAYIGFECPDGHMRVGVTGIAGGDGEYRCSKCKKLMVPIKQEESPKVDNQKTVVDGTHSAKGNGNVTGLDIKKPVILKHGTKASAEGTGNLTALKIGNNE